MSSLWFIGAYAASIVFPKLRVTWNNAMYRLESEDQEEYLRFQKGLTSFFEQYPSHNTHDGFEKL